jgi:hypothetical protein
MNRGADLTARGAAPICFFFNPEWALTRRRWVRTRASFPANDEKLEWEVSRTEMILKKNTQLLQLEMSAGYTNHDLNFDRCEIE